MRRALALLCLALSLTACGKQRVATQPDLPPLAPPPPPPRIVAPPDTEQLPAPTPEPERKPPRRTPARTEGVREPPKPEPPKPQVPPATPPAKEEPQPPTTLQTTGATQLEMERRARGLLAQARKDLSNVKLGSLNTDDKRQYEMARRFVEQGEQALKEQNFVLAQSLGDKAATIAGVLVGR